MTTTEITVVLGTLGSLVLVALAVVAALRANKDAKAAHIAETKKAIEDAQLKLVEDRKHDAEVGTQSWESITTALQADRVATDARYASRLQEVEQDYDRRITKIKESLREEMEDMARQIKSLKKELVDLAAGRPKS